MITLLLEERGAKTVIGAVIHGAPQTNHDGIPNGQPSICKSTSGASRSSNFSSACYMTARIHTVFANSRTLKY
eukprot:3220603-Amphidinium_carterae.1